MDSKTLADKLRMVGLDRFASRYYNNPLECAKDCLTGRTHYVSDDTRRFFSSRILMTSILDNGLLLGIIESVQHPELGRVQRCVFFDVAGNVVSRGDFDDSATFFRSGKAAHKAFWLEANRLDGVAITLALLAKLRDRHLREAEEMATLLAEAAPVAA